MHLDDADRAMLAGEEGPGVALAMRVVKRVAETMQADRLLDITGAHIDSCLFHGKAGLDFAARLADTGAQVKVPTTLNVSSLDLLHPELYRGDVATGTDARQLMAYYEALGCRPTWTCAPYQLEERPGLGEHVAWAESNAIVFANSVLGARTHRYGDFIDICAALTGRAPAAGLHLDEQRLATIEVNVEQLSALLLDTDALYPVLGHLVGGTVGTDVAAIVGLPDRVSEDRLKALGAAAASSGSVGMFHAVGSTPEAATHDDAFGGQGPGRVVTVTGPQIRAARDQLSTATGDRLGAVSLGTPHYSVAEFERLIELLGGRSVNPAIAFYVSTGRDVVHELQLRGWLGPLEAAGVQLVTDTCTYITPVMRDFDGAAMTDSAKWAYYAPGNIGVEVIFGSTEDCVESAVAGVVCRDDGVWHD